MYKSVYAYKYCLNENFPIWANNAPLKSHELPNKNPNTRPKKPPFVCWSGLTKKLPNHYRLLQLPLVAAQGRR